VVSSHFSMSLNNLFGQGKFRNSSMLVVGTKFFTIKNISIMFMMPNFVMVRTKEEENSFRRIKLQ